ncbi:uncharacterized protein LOC133741137 [Rosa rugosa]|uniref:uncharacterized protein LOC133741137 n=1 Tax=Rosa rugosa TaxID=74645 RepID=UPI002B40DA15|nr:uncharacterized protein LOC133741137 [Rosa rugosa]
MKPLFSSIFKSFELVGKKQPPSSSASPPGPTKGHICNMSTVECILCKFSVLLQKLGYIIYRRVLRYYSGEEDGLDMRKALSRDVEKKSIIPLKRPVTPDELRGKIVRKGGFSFDMSIITFYVLCLFC